MEIKTNTSGSVLMLSVEGRLDTNTAPELDSVINKSIDGITELILDFEKLSYISSAGLRVLLKAQKKMNRRGSMRVLNVNDEIMEIFEVTGFGSILTIQNN